MSGAHSYRGFERAVRGPHGVVGEPRGNVAQVTPIETQIPGVIGDHGSIFASEIEFLPRHTGHRFSGLRRGGPQKRSIDRGELGVIVRAACAQQERFDGFEVDLCLDPLALRSAHVGDEKVSAARDR